VTGSAVVTGTNGDGVRCRSGAGFNASVLMVLAEGAALSLRGPQQGDWQPVVCGGQNGFVFADFVGTGSGSGNGSDNGDSGGAPSNSDLGAGQNATVTGTGGQGVRLRAGAGFNAAIITVVPEGKVVSVINGSTGDWVAVSYNGTSGFIMMDYLSAGGSTDGGSNSSNGDTTSGSADALAKGDHAVTLASLNLRYDASYSAGIAAVAPEGTVVKVTGPSVNGFYPVDWDGLAGYMHGDYLQATSAGLSSRGGSGDPNNGGTNGGTTDGNTSGGDAPATATGQQIVNFALQYVGYPYVWATHGPSSFDCSGFTHWVFQNVAGMDITYNNVTQYAYGYEVSRDALAPGDLVFFQNTYTWGNSHVGIYIGNGQFIHAENESTGVVISSLSSPYYSSRWYGARRLV
jgi:cell wall-associated NlpC family hydrolase